jgi:cell filamentation protein
MKKQGRYKTAHLEQDQYEPGSNGRVLRNLLGIKKKREMDIKEADEYLRTFGEVIDMYNEDDSLTADDICKMHSLWLGNIYPWAGKYRNVNVTKDNFTFAMALQIQTLMDSFEKNVLKKFTPCCNMSGDVFPHALSVVHAELILIHPF